MKLNLPWSNIFPLWIYTRQGKWWTTSYNENPDAQWVYVLAVSKTRDPGDHSYIQYPVWRYTRVTKDRILSAYDTFDEALDVLYETLDELAYIAAGWMVKDGDSLPCMPYVYGKPAPLQEGIGSPPTPPRGSLS